MRYKTLLGTCLAGMALMGTWGSIQWAQPWANKMAVGTDSAQTAASYTQICSGIGAIIGTLAAAYLRRVVQPPQVVLRAVPGSLAVCGYLFRTPMQFDGTFLLLIGLAGCLTASFYGWLPLYLPELFPTRIRATGQGFAFNFGRVLAAAGALESGQSAEPISRRTTPACARSSAWSTWRAWC